MKQPSTSLLALTLAATLWSTFAFPDPPAGQETGQEEEAGQEGADPLDDPLMPPLQRYRRQRKVAIEKEIVGNWILMDFSDPNTPLSEEIVDGWASFHDGYLTMFLQMRTIERAIFSDTERRYFQYGSHRYRISEDLYLQTAVILASTNINEDRDILYETSGYPREFELTLVDNLLEMTNIEGITLKYRRVEPTEFPVEAIEELQEAR